VGKSRAISDLEFGILATEVLRRGDLNLGDRINLGGWSFSACEEWFEKIIFLSPTAWLL
jgi:hypothetical protein